MEDVFPDLNMGIFQPANVRKYQRVPAISGFWWQRSIASWIGLQWSSCACHAYHSHQRREHPSGHESTGAPLPKAAFWVFFCASFPHHWDPHLLNAMVEVTYNNITLNTNEHLLSKLMVGRWFISFFLVPIKRGDNRSILRVYIYFFGWLSTLQQRATIQVLLVCYGCMHIERRSASDWRKCWKRFGSEPKLLASLKLTN